ncbi:hypothetical protein ACI0X9_003390 [Cronobacter turicensis]
MHKSPLSSDAEHDEALTEAERLITMNPPAGSVESLHLEHLATIIEEYEKMRWPTSQVSQTELDAFRLRESGSVK